MKYSCGNHFCGRHSYEKYIFSILSKVDELSMNDLVKGMQELNNKMAKLEEKRQA